MDLQPWKVHQSRYIVKDKWLTLRADRCETSAGVTVDPFYIFEKKDWAHAVVFDHRNRVLVVRQYRHGCRHVVTEVPCGVIDSSDDSPLDAAKRELLEETGCIADNFQFVYRAYANPARQTNMIHCFVGFDARQVAAPQLDEAEQIESEFVELTTLFDLIDQGAFSQTLHISSIYQTLRHIGSLGIRPMEQPG